MEHDLTKGRVSDQLFRFTLPILGANLLQSLYNMVDMLVVGRFLGSSGLAALSNATSICYLLTALSSGITVGGSVLVAQYTGAHDTTNRRTAVGTLFTLTALFGAAITALSLLSYPAVLRAMRTPLDAMPHAMGYMAVVSFGTWFVLGYNAVGSILRGLGDSKSPLLFVALASAVNVALDLLFVGPLHMGAAGAALATVLSQAVSFFLSLVFLVRRAFFRGFQPGDFFPKRNHVLAILRIGLPSAVQMSVVNFSYLLAMSMFNVFGTAAAAASGLGLKINTIAAMPCWAVGTAVTNMAGQCMGAEDSVRAGHAAVEGVKLAVLWEIPIFLVITFFAPQIVWLFDPASNVMEAGGLYLRICCSFNIFIYAVMYVLDSFATGVGCATLAMMNAILHSVVIRLGLSWLFAFAMGFGFLGLCSAEMLAPIPCAVVGVVFFLHGKWKTKQVI